MSLSSSFVQGGEGLLGLHEALMADRFVVGPGELLAATRLLVRLAETGQLPADAADLEPWLRAVYCKSAAEQKRFGTGFKNWLAARKPKQVFQEAGAAPGALPDSPPVKSRSRWLRVIPAVAIVALLLFIVWQRYTPDPPDRPPDVAPAPGDSAGAPSGPTGSTPSKPAPAPAVDTREATAGLTAYVPAQRTQREFRPWVVLLLLALPLPLLVLLYAPALVLSRRHGERSRQGGRVSLDVSDWRMEAERVVPALDLRTAARLDRHVRPSFDAPTLGTRAIIDAPRTIAATLRRHSLTLRWRPRRARPSYLVLIDIHDEHDLRGRLFFRWADRLRREGVAVDIWLFDRDPRTLYPADRRRVLDSSGRDRNAVQFEHVAGRATTDPVHRLVVVSDGAGFFVDGTGNELRDWWTTLGWARWPQRVMFTPLDVRDWGKREVAIERALGRGSAGVRDPGFLVLPLEQEALDAYALYLTRGQLPRILLASSRRYPSIIDRLPQRGLSPTAPEPEQIERLIEQLRLYLGDNGLRWFAACAIPPLTRWELTLLIGQALFRELGADDEESLRWLMATNYPRLARLPWLREANIPDWLALRLLNELSPRMQDRVRDVVRDLLLTVPTVEDIAAGDVLALDCAPPAGGGSSASPRPVEPAESVEEKDKRERRQWLYLGFLDGLSPRQLAMRAPPKWRNYVTDGITLAAHGTGLRRLGQMLLDWVRAFGARLMWRDGQAGSGAAGRPLWLALAWFGAVIVGLLALAARPVDTLSPVIDNALFVERDIGIGDVSELPFRSLAFSRDGSRFVVAETGGEVQVRNTGIKGTAGAAGKVFRVAGGLVGAHLNASGDEVITVTRQGVVASWDVDGRNKAQTAPLPGVSPIVASVMDARDLYVALHSLNGDFHVIPLSGTVKQQVEPGTLRPASGTLPAELAFLNVELNGVLLALDGGSIAGSEPFSGVGFALSLPVENAGRGWLSPDGRYAAVSSAGGRAIQVFDLVPVIFDGETLAADAATRAKSARAVQVKAQLTLRFETPIARVALASGSQRVAVVLESGEVRVWEAGRNPPLLGVIPAITGEAAPAPHLAPGGGALLLRQGRQVTAYNLERTVMADAGATGAKGAAPTTFAPLGVPLSHTAAVVDLVFAPDGNRLLTATSDHEVRLWERAQLRIESRVEPTPESPQRVVAVSAGGSRAASAGADGRITVWSPVREAIEATLEHPQNARDIAALAFTADGTLLASAALDGSVRLWDLRQKKPIGEASHGSAVAAVQFDAEGQFLVSVGAGSARLWRIGESGPQAGPTLGARDVVAARFYPDGRSVLTASRDGTLQRWNVEGGQLLTAARIDDADPTAAGVKEQPRPAVRSSSLPSPQSGPASAVAPSAELPAQTDMSWLRSLRLASSERVPDASLFDGIQLAQAQVPAPTAVQVNRAGQVMAAPKWLDSVVGLPLERARAVIKEQGFTIGNIKYAPSKANDGSVQLVVPTGTLTVDLVVAGDAALVRVPDVTQMQLEQARSELRRSGLSIGSVQYSVSRVPAGIVRSTTPAPGAYVPSNTRVGLSVSGTPAEETPRQEPAPGTSHAAGGARCRSGFVSRDAFAGDSVCVTPAVRAQVQQDNTQARSRIDPINRAFGAETCRSGFVWREADRYLRGERFTDKICVAPAQRDQAAADNTARGERGDTRAAPGDVPAVRGGTVTALQDVLLEVSGAPLVAVSGQHARLLDAATLRQVGPPAVTHADMTQARYLASSALIATASLDGRVRLWNAATGQESEPPLLNGAPVLALQAASDGRLLATLDSRGRVRVWDVEARRPLAQEQPGERARAPADKSAKVASVQRANSAGPLTPTSADRLSALHELGPTAIVAFAFDADGTRVITASNDGRAYTFAFPSPVPGILRGVRPYAVGWLVLLALLAAASVTAAFAFKRDCERRLAAIRSEYRDVDTARDVAARPAPTPMAEAA